ncbi:MAG TPA: phosphotransferase [Tepidisphaeraceae bacterium]|jgi:hypothetical protein|nr:phosphotransferase [Tepidisphaeraceae bacterium]
MGHRKSILESHGYTAVYEEREKYRGGPKGLLCLARRGNSEYFAFKHKGRYRRLYEVQDSIPHMARIVDLVEDVAVFEKAIGKLLWDFEIVPDLDSVERQLSEFVSACQRNALVHGDLRPWNVFFDGKNITVIDWDSSRFTDELVEGDELLIQLRAHGHKGISGSDAASVDSQELALLMRVLRSEIGLNAAWCYTRFAGRPKWCLE